MLVLLVSHRCLNVQMLYATVSFLKKVMHDMIGVYNHVSYVIKGIVLDWGGRGSVLGAQPLLFEF